MDSKVLNRLWPQCPWMLARETKAKVTMDLWSSWAARITFPDWKLSCYNPLTLWCLRWVCPKFLVSGKTFARTQNIWYVHNTGLGPRRRPSSDWSAKGSLPRAMSSDATPVPSLPTLWPCASCPIPGWDLLDFILLHFQSPSVIPKRSRF